MLGAQRCVQLLRGALVEDRLDERVHVVGALLGLRQHLRRGRGPRPSSTSRLPCAPSSEATVAGPLEGLLPRDSVRMCTTPERRPCGSGPPRRSMSTSSPVTERTTSGPVTKIRPSGPRITTSVSAGPYAAPPAAGPSTTEICGILPEAWVITWKIRPTACSDSTPSASRAPPECQSPMIGTPGRSSPGGRRRRRPCSRRRPSRRPSRWRRSRRPRRGVPSTVPTAASMPQSSSGGDQLERALVEQRREPVVRVARVLLAGQLGGLRRARCGCVMGVLVGRVRRCRRRRRRWRRRSRRSC